MNFNYALIEKNLMQVLEDLKSQSSLADRFPGAGMSYEDQMSQISEWIQDAGEFGLAYETMVSLLESFPVMLTGSAAVRLLEVGLIFGFKSDSDNDKPFDRR